MTGVTFPDSMRPERNSRSAELRFATTAFTSWLTKGPASIEAARWLIRPPMKT